MNGQTMIKHRTKELLGGKLRKVRVWGTPVPRISSPCSHKSNTIIIRSLLRGHKCMSYHATLRARENARTHLTARNKGTERSWCTEILPGEFDLPLRTVPNARYDNHIAGIFPVAKLGVVSAVKHVSVSRAIYCMLTVSAHAHSKLQFLFNFHSY